MIYNDNEKKSKVNKNTMGRGHVDSLPDWGGFVASSFVRREKRIKGKYWAEAQEKMKNKKKKKKKKKNRLGR